MRHGKLSLTIPVKPPQFRVPWASAPYTLPMPIAVTVFIVLADQFTKWLVIRSIPLYNEPIPVLFGFHLTHTRNTGAAFGMLHGWSLGPLTGTTLLTVFSIAASAYIVYVLVTHGKALGAPVRIALGMILGGAVGNIIDRVLHGYVTDFVHFKLGSFEFAIFNVADSAVVVGAIIILLASVFTPTKTTGSDRGR